MPSCAVLTCQSSTERPGEDITFHRFPRDKEVKGKWVDMTGRDNWIPANNSVICSKHFRDNDYFIKRSGKRYLKTTAIPCEFVVYRLFTNDEDPIPSSSSRPADGDDSEATAAVAAPPTSDPRTPSPTQEADTTLYLNDYGINDNPVGWDQFQLKMIPLPSLDLPPPMDVQPGMDIQSNLVHHGPSTADFQPDMEHLVPIMDDQYPMMDDTDPPREEPRSKRSKKKKGRRTNDPIARINKLISKRKVCQKAVSAAIAEVREATKFQWLLQQGKLMSQFEKTNSIINSLFKQIATIKADLRNKRKQMKDIYATVQNIETSFFVKLTSYENEKVQ